MADTTRATVLADLVMWQEQIPGTNPPTYSHHRANRGAEVELPAGEFERLRVLEAVAPVDVGEAALEGSSDDALSGPVPAGAEGDEQLRAASATQLIAYVTQNPDEAERVAGIERERKQQRATVLRAAGYDPDTGEKIPGAGPGDPNEGTAG